MRILVFLYLALNSWTDYRHREIDVRFTLVFTGIVTVYHIWKHTWRNIWGVIPGAGLWLLGYLLEKEKVGTGDGIVVMALGWALGFGKVYKVLLIAFAVVGLAGFIFLIRGKKKTDQIPFVPFLMLGFLWGECLK